MRRLPPTMTFITAGTLPFVALSVAISFHMFRNTHMVMELLLTYAVVIISFLGGIHLGVALSQNSKNKIMTNLLIAESLWPSLIGWSLLYTADMHIQLLALSILYVLMLAIDSLLYNNNLIPLWFYNLRCIITPIVTVSLYVAYFGVI